jgi:hypothetical protein
LLVDSIDLPYEIKELITYNAKFLFIFSITSSSADGGGGELLLKCG